MEKLYEKYSNLVYSYFKKVSEDKDIAEELTQETFYKAIRGINNFRGDCTLSNWICQIAKNVWKDYLKKQHKIKLISIEDDTISNLLIDEKLQYNAESREELINLYRNIHKLEEKKREILYLRLLGDFSYKEIGIILGKNEEWVRINFYRAKNKIKEELEND